MGQPAELFRSEQVSCKGNLAVSGLMVMMQTGFGWNSLPFPPPFLSLVLAPPPPTPLFVWLLLLDYTLQLAAPVLKTSECFSTSCWSPAVCVPSPSLWHCHTVLWPRLWSAELWKMGLGRRLKKKKTVFKTKLNLKVLHVWNLEVNMLQYSVWRLVVKSQTGSREAQTCVITNSIQLMQSWVYSGILV